MTLEEIEAALAAALSLRSPILAPDDSGRRKIEVLQNYMLLTAHVSGDLVEAKHWLAALIDRLAGQWESLAGWEVALKRPRAKATKAEIDQAKIVVEPQLYAAGRKARALRESVVDQIARLEREERVMSRAYTMLSGG